MKEEQVKSDWESYAASPTRELRNRLAEAYLPLAAKIASRFTGRGLDYDDLLQTASLALLKAIEGFDPSRGVRFTTYAVPTLIGVIRNELRDKAAPIRLPEGQMEKLRAIVRVRISYEKEHFRTPTPQEIADLLHMDAADVLLLTSRSFVSLDAPVDEDGTDYAELLGAPDEAFAQMENNQWMDALKKTSSETEQKLLNYRFVRNLSQRETARLMGISQMQVSRLEKRLLARLRSLEEKT